MTMPMDDLDIPPVFENCDRCRHFPCLVSLFEELRQLRAHEAFLCRDLTEAQERIAELEAKLQGQQR